MLFDALFSLQRISINHTEIVRHKPPAHALISSRYTHFVSKLLFSVDERSKEKEVD